MPLTLQLRECERIILDVPNEQAVILHYYKIGSHGRLSIAANPRIKIHRERIESEPVELERITECG